MLTDKQLTGVLPKTMCIDSLWYYPTLWMSLRTFHFKEWDGFCNSLNNDLKFNLQNGYLNICFILFWNITVLPHSFVGRII